MADEDLNKFNVAHWWILLGGAGAVIAPTSITVQFVPGFLMGLGLLFFGVGEWINRPQRTEIQTSKIVGTYIKTTNNPWKPTVVGVVFDALGIGLFLFGLFLIVPHLPLS
jgi:hypothetical protein